MARERIGSGVEPDQLRLLAEAAAEAEPEVNRHADDQGNIGSLQSGAPRPAEGQLMVGGKATAAEPVEEDRNAERFGESTQLNLAMAPVETAAGHDRWPLGACQQGRRLLDPASRLGIVASGIRNLLVRLAEDDVERIVDEGRPERRAERQIERRGRPRPDRARLLDRLRRLDQRRDERQVVDLLQRARAPAHLRRPPTQHTDR